MRNTDGERPRREVRATYDDTTVTVYQAYSPAIAGPAVEAGRFVPPFKRERMTWVKPSWTWMMYRCGHATKVGQERVLAVRLSRSGFEEALRRSCLSHFEEGTYADEGDWAARKAASPVRVQWDPERSATLEALPWRSLQVGLSGWAVDRYVDDWVVAISDVTDRARARADAPVEVPYPLPDDVRRIVGASPPGI